MVYGSLPLVVVLNYTFCIQILLTGRIKALRFLCKRVGGISRKVIQVVVKYSYGISLLNRYY